MSGSRTWRLNRIDEMLRGGLAARDGGLMSGCWRLNSTGEMLRGEFAAAQRHGVVG